MYERLAVRMRQNACMCRWNCQLKCMYVFNKKGILVCGVWDKRRVAPQITILPENLDIKETFPTLKCRLASIFHFLSIRFCVGCLFDFQLNWLANQRWSVHPRTPPGGSIQSDRTLLVYLNFNIFVFSLKSNVFDVKRLKAHKWNIILVHHPKVEYFQLIATVRSLHH